MLLGAWAEVYRKDRKYPYIAKVSFDEYNKGQSTWKSMPKTMIRKVAIVQALREAFPVDLGALYVEEEAQAVTGVEHEVKEEIKNKANTKTIGFSKENVQDVAYKEVEPEPVEKTKEKLTQQQISIEGPGF
ncbi:recombinase RecT [Caloranaerobacter azorensis]|uniref:recombinase RecT n=1 Tax=Caloranaerobacter azorensis TaxID=116090 RepID=UPI0024DE87EF|nr:recombinase RecT [Caloranaerobacter azorensis]